MSEKSIKVTYLADPLTDIEDDAKFAESVLKRIGGIPAKILHVTSAPHDIPKSTDLLVIDYGGMSVFGGEGNSRFAVMMACEWAENHPGKLVLIWTAYTAKLYDHELQATFGHLDNIVFRYPAHKVFPNASEEKELDERLRATLQAYYGCE